MIYHRSVGRSFVEAHRGKSNSASGGRHAGTSAHTPAGRPAVAPEDAADAIDARAKAIIIIITQSDPAAAAVSTADAVDCAEGRSLCMLLRAVCFNWVRQSAPFLL